MIVAELIVILLLLALNGVFAMSELAVVTARKVRLEQRADEGDKGALAALKLAHDPTQFLSTVQVGITLIGVLAGAFGGATMSEKLAAVFARVPALAPYANALGLGLVVTLITYLSLLIGELIPKRVALSNPERVASLVARPMQVLARFAAPLVKLLTAPTNLVLRLFGIRVSAEPSITVEEIRSLVEQGAETGVVAGVEHQMVEGVFRLGDRLVSDLMTPRTKLEWIDVSEPEDAIRKQIIAQARSRSLVCDGTVDNVVGVVFAEDLLVQCLSGRPLDLRSRLWQPLYVPAWMPGLVLLEQLRASRQQVAVALDEYGGLQGVVMLDDLVETVVGELPLPGESSTPRIARQGEGVWMVHGSASLEDVETTLDLDDISEDIRGSVRTVGGLVMMLLGRVANVGDVVTWDGVRAEVTAVDGRRVERVTLTKLAQAPTAEMPSAGDSTAPDAES
jgi:putative hemolysin